MTHNETVNGVQAESDPAGNVHGNGADATLGDILSARACQHPEREALAFMPDVKSGIIRDRLTYGQLGQHARDVAAGVTALGYRAGQRALLLFPQGLDFAEAFFGCAYAGLIAVPAPPPEGSRASRERLAGLLADAQPALVLTDDATAPAVLSWLSGQPGATGTIPCITASSLAGRAVPRWTPPAVTSGDLALLQYTSGSTAEPKGVMVTHGNLVANLRLAHTFMGRPRTRGCGWLPLTHDMGLIGQFLITIYAGGWCLLLPPLEFAKRPYRWLELMSSYGAAQAIGPNFAYDLCARTVSEERIATLDLSRWTMAINGAEPIDPRTLEGFAKKFAPAGFRPEAFAPCYGLAEATLFVSGTPHDQPPVVTMVDGVQLALGRFVPVEGSGATGAAGAVQARALVSSGTVVAGSVLIVDPRSRHPRGDREVGEIWVTGSSVAKGYWGQPELTEAVFNARTAGGQAGYLRTGDLGVLDGERLYVTGRIKDVIIVRGRNLYPHDLEHAVRDQAGDLRFASTAVFALDGADGGGADGGGAYRDGDIVVVQGLQRSRHEPDELAAAAARIKHHLAQDWGADRASVIFVRASTISKTTSGKIRRVHMRQLFLRAALNPVYESLAPGVSGRLEEMK